MHLTQSEGPRPAPNNLRSLRLPEASELTPAWSAGICLYQLNLHNYTPEGTLSAALEHIPRIADLGVGAIWLMPVHPRGRRRPSRAASARWRGSPLPLQDPEIFDGNPYCPRDHRQLDSDLGSEEDLHRFVDAARALGLAVVQGWVPNHTSWDAPLLAEHPECYQRGEAGQVMQHGPWEDIARLDYEGAGGPLLAEYMLDARRWWVERFGVQGFREDVASSTPLGHWRWLRRQLDPDRRLLMLGECHDAKLLGPFDAIYDQELTPLYWQIIAGDAPTESLDWKLERYAGDIGSAEGSGEGRRLRFLFNHDQTGGAGFFAFPKWSRPRKLMTRPRAAYRCHQRVPATWQVLGVGQHARTSRVL